MNKQYLYAVLLGGTQKSKVFRIEKYNQITLGKHYEQRNNLAPGAGK